MVARSREGAIAVPSAPVTEVGVLLGRGSKPGAFGAGTWVDGTWPTLVVDMDASGVLVIRPCVLLRVLTGVRLVDDNVAGGGGKVWASATRLCPSLIMLTGGNFVVEEAGGGNGRVMSCALYLRASICLLRQ